jgi:hypothetical protein
MGRVEDLSKELKELFELQDSRPWTSEEWGQYFTATQFLNDQMDANGRRRLEAEATRATACQNGSSKKSLFHIRLSCVDGNLDSFHKLLTKVAGSGYVDQAYEFVYVLEQSGADEESRGHNPHAHIRCRCYLKNESVTKGRIASKLKRTTGLPDSAIQVMVHDNINALKNYMAGNKGPLKVSSCDQDKIWRMENGLKREYVVQRL